MKFDDLLTGFIRLHVLHHAAEQEIYGVWMIEELAHHGYKLSPGTLYPMLHAMEEKGHLESRTKRNGRSVRNSAGQRSSASKALRLQRRVSGSSPERR
jgi:PadR family transcriptional regulator, regulatory protein PadR